MAKKQLKEISMAKKQPKNNKQDIINDYESTGLHTTAWGDLTNVHLNIMFEYQAMEDYDLFNDNDITVYIATERSERLNNLYLARYFATQIQNYRKQNGIKSPEPYVADS